MRHSQALAAAAVAAALATGAGCVTRSTYNRDLAAERARTEAVQEKLDQAHRDVKKAWDALAQKAADYTSNQKAADDARRQLSSLRQQIEQLQSSVRDAEKNAKAAADKASSDEAEKLKKLQEQFDAAQKENSDLRELAEKQKAQIAELKARLEENSSTPPPIHTMPMIPAPGAPAGT